ncbi:MAG TPA: regulatory protein RecX [Bacteroidales bacterium]|nr:regulatory protein RecX [Bacteroidales bacterium]
MVNNITKEEALSRAMHLCSRQEKCLSDVRKKLHDWKLDEKHIPLVLNKLVEEKFIDEQRFAGFAVKDKFRLNQWGKIKIGYHLRQKQLPEQIIQEALASIDEREYEEMLKDLLVRKKKSLKESDPYKLKAKLLRFAASRGFEQSLVYDQIDQLLKEK